MAWITYTDDLEVQIVETRVNGKTGYEVFITDEEYDEDDASLIFQDLEGLVSFSAQLANKIVEEGLLFDYWEAKENGA